MENPVVSVCLLSYKQCEYIRQAIDSVISQKCNFSYEIVVGDDGSNDGTKEVLLEYAVKYPGIFNLLINEKNGGVMANLYRVLTNCKGKYIANLEADDYWIDENKLQLQVDYLESHKDASAVGANYYSVDENGENKRISLMPYECNKVYRMRDYLKNGMLMHTNTLLYRNVFDFTSSTFRETLLCAPTMGDVFMRCNVYDRGYVYCFQSPMLCHRETLNVASSFQAQQIDGANRYTWMMFDIVKHMQVYFEKDYKLCNIVINRMAYLFFFNSLKRINLDMLEYKRTVDELDFYQKGILVHRIVRLYFQKARRTLYRRFVLKDCVP